MKKLMLAFTVVVVFLVGGGNALADQPCTGGQLQGMNVNPYMTIWGRCTVYSEHGSARGTLRSGHNSCSNDEPFGCHLTWNGARTCCVDASSASVLWPAPVITCPETYIPGRTVRITSDVPGGQAAYWTVQTSTGTLINNASRNIGPTFSSSVIPEGSGAIIVRVVRSPGGADRICTISPYVPELPSDPIVSTISVSFSLNGVPGQVPSGASCIIGSSPDNGCVGNASGSCCIQAPSLPLRSGYYFRGWGSNSACTGTTRHSNSPQFGNAPRGRILVSATNSVLYACWENVRRTVTFDLNGGVGSTPSTETCTPVTGERMCSVPLPTTDATRAGYTFNGWGLRETCTLGRKASSPVIVGGHPEGSWRTNASPTLFACWLGDGAVPDPSPDIDNGRDDDTDTGADGGTGDRTCVIDGVTRNDGSTEVTAARFCRDLDRENPTASRAHGCQAICPGPTASSPGYVNISTSTYRWTSGGSGGGAQSCPPGYTNEGGPIVHFACAHAVGANCGNDGQCQRCIPEGGMGGGDDDAGGSGDFDIKFSYCPAAISRDVSVRNEVRHRSSPTNELCMAARKTTNTDETHWNREFIRCWDPNSQDYADEAAIHGENWLYEMCNNRLWVCNRETGEPRQTSNAYAFGDEGIHVCNMNLARNDENQLGWGIYEQGYKGCFFTEEDARAACAGENRFYICDATSPSVDFTPAPPHLTTQYACNEWRQQQRTGWREREWDPEFFYCYTPDEVYAMNENGTNFCNNLLLICNPSYAGGPRIRETSNAYSFSTTGEDGIARCIRNIQSHFADDYEHQCWPNTPEGREAALYYCPDTCTDHEDCDEGECCYEGECVEGDVNDEGECVPTREVCPPEVCTEENEDDACPGEDCICDIEEGEEYGVCRGGEGAPCEEEEDCAGELCCVDNICTADVRDEDGNCPGPELCPPEPCVPGAEDDPCDSEYCVCDYVLDDPECRGDVGAPCEEDTDCASWLCCLDGVCTDAQDEDGYCPGDDDYDGYEPCVWIDGEECCYHLEGVNYCVIYNNWPENAWGLAPQNNNSRPRIGEIDRSPNLSSTRSRWANAGQTSYIYFNSATGQPGISSTNNRPTLCVGCEGMCPDDTWTHSPIATANLLCDANPPSVAISRTLPASLSQFGFSGSTCNLASWSNGCTLARCLEVAQAVIDVYRNCRNNEPHSLYNNWMTTSNSAVWRRCRPSVAQNLPQTAPSNACVRITTPTNQTEVRYRLRRPSDTGSGLALSGSGISILDYRTAPPSSSSTSGTCTREIVVEANKLGGDGTCGEDISLMVRITGDGTVSGGGSSATTGSETICNYETQDGVDIFTDPYVFNVNSCECRTRYFVAEFVVDTREVGDVRMTDFVYNPELNACISHWSRLTSVEDGVRGAGPDWGDAGSNGRWFLEEGNAAAAGWTFLRAPDPAFPNAPACSFVCTGTTPGGPADCFGREPLSPDLTFIPDLRLVVVNDPAFLSAAHEVQIPGVGNNCSLDGVNEVLTRASVTTANRTDANSGLIHDNAFDVRRFYYTFTNPNRDTQGRHWRVGYTYNNSDIKSEVESGGLSEMIYGIDENGNLLRGATGFDLMTRITNNFDKETQAGYWACACPTVAGAAASQVENAANQDCRIIYTPQVDANVCTTRRIYVGFRTCYHSAWWQVSGGNVFAQGNVVSFVPPNLSDMNCVDEDVQCLNVSPNNAGYHPDFPGENTVADGSRRCTPRMIRGRTPCKADGPSNSAGFAMSQIGQAIAADLGDYTVLNPRSIDPNFPLTTEELVQRVTERANIHALHQGPYYGDNNRNNLGLQARVAFARVVARLDRELTWSDIDQIREAMRNNTATGFNPPREDFAFFVNQLGGATRLEMMTVAGAGSGDSHSRDFQLRNIGTWCSAGHMHGDAEGMTREPVVAGQELNYEVYTCFFPGNLIIDANYPWYVETYTSGGGAGSVATFYRGRKYTFFVGGDLILQGVNPEYAAGGADSARLNDAVTAVDVGSFLGFVVSGNIIIDPHVGIVMPNPRAANVDLGVCWEGQTATLNPNFYTSGLNSPDIADGVNRSINHQGIPTYQFRSAVGSVEGFFLADGDIVVQRFERGEACNPINLSDRRFIGQGIFAVWGTSNFLRDFNQRDRGCQDDTHGVFANRVPTETFVYRPDLVRNLPFWMRRVGTTYTDITGGAR